MSDEELRKKVMSLIGSDVKASVTEAVGLQMKDLGSIVRREMDACLDGKCDAIAAKVIEKFPEFPKVDIPTLPIEDITKAVKEAMGEIKPSVTVEGHTAHDILSCPTCRPVVVENLWKDEEYRQKVMEKVCEDDECRQAISKMFEKKGYEVKKRGAEPREETWAEKRLRERREHKPD